MLQPQSKTCTALPPGTTKCRTLKHPTAALLRLSSIRQIAAGMPPVFHLKGKRNAGGLLIAGFNVCDLLTRHCWAVRTADRAAASPFGGTHAKSVLIQPEIRKVSGAASAIICSVETLAKVNPKSVIARPHPSPSMNLEPQMNLPTPHPALSPLRGEGEETRRRFKSSMREFTPR